MSSANIQIAVSWPKMETTYVLQTSLARASADAHVSQHESVDPLQAPRHKYYGRDRRLLEVNTSLARTVPCRWRFAGEPTPTPACKENDFFNLHQERLLREQPLFAPIVTSLATVDRMPSKQRHQKSSQD